MTNSLAGSLKKKPTSTRAIFGKVMTGIATLCMILTLVPLAAVLYFVIVQGFNRLTPQLFTELPPPPGLEGGGLANAIIGTLIVVGIATVIAVPIGVLAAVYLSEFSNDNQIARGVRFATNVLSGVPSIIAGIFAFGLLVSPELLQKLKMLLRSLLGMLFAEIWNTWLFQWLQWLDQLIESFFGMLQALQGFSAIAGGVALAVLMLPTIVRTTDEALQIVPQDIRWAALGVGAYNYQTVLKIVIPAALPAILTGVTLSIARAAGETAPLIFTALYSNFWPEGIFEPIATLSVLVYNFAIVPFKPQQELAWAGSLILVLLVLATSVAARLATRSKTY